MKQADEDHSRAVSDELIRFSALRIFELNTRWNRAFSTLAQTGEGAYFVLNYFI